MHAAPALAWYMPGGQMRVSPDAAEASRSARAWPGTSRRQNCGSNRSPRHRLQTADGRLQGREARQVATRGPRGWHDAAGSTRVSIHTRTRLTRLIPELVYLSLCWCCAGSFYDDAFLRVGGAKPRCSSTHPGKPPACAGSQGSRRQGEEAHLEECQSTWRLQEGLQAGLRTPSVSCGPSSAAFGVAFGHQQTINIKIIGKCLMKVWIIHRRSKLRQQCRGTATSSRWS